MGRMALRALECHEHSHHRTHLRICSRCLCHNLSLQQQHSKAKESQILTCMGALALAQCQLNCLRMVLCLMHRHLLLFRQYQQMLLCLHPYQYLPAKRLWHNKRWPRHLLPLLP